MFVCVYVCVCVCGQGRVVLLVLMRSTCPFWSVMLQYMVAGTFRMTSSNGDRVDRPGRLWWLLKWLCVRVRVCVSMTSPTKEIMGRVGNWGTKRVRFQQPTGQTETTN